MWQDYVIMGGSIGFAVALIPSIRNNAKIPQSTSFMTGSILTVFGTVYATLDLTFGCIAALVTASFWFVIAYKNRG